MTKFELLIAPASASPAGAKKVKGQSSKVKGQSGSRNPEKFFRDFGIGSIPRDRDSGSGFGHPSHGHCGGICW